MTEQSSARVLGFCQSHDWGRNAVLVIDAKDRSYQIANLTDWALVDGEWVASLVAIPATMAAAREFGNY